MTDWSSTRLTADHDLHAFDSGQTSLDQWLRQNARRADEQGTARTWVWTRAEALKVEAYFSVAPTQVARDILTSSQCGGVAVVPGYLLARLALDRALQGDQLGGQLLRDALERIVAASRQTGGRLVVVDAIDARAERFYANFNFQQTRAPSTAERSGKAGASPTYPRRMVIKIATVQDALGL